MIYLRFKEGVLQATDHPKPTVTGLDDGELYASKMIKFESSWLPVVNHEEVMKALPSLRVPYSITTDGKEYQIEGKIEITSEFGTHLSRPMASVIPEKKDKPFCGPVVGVPEYGESSKFAFEDMARAMYEKYSTVIEGRRVMPPDLFTLALWDYQKPMTNELDSIRDEVKMLNDKIEKLENNLNERIKYPHRFL